MRKLIAIVGIILSLVSYGADPSLTQQVQAFNPKLTEQQAAYIVDIEHKYAQKYDIPVEVGLSLSAKESTFKPSAKSYTGESYGLKMVHYKVWRRKFKGLTKQCLMDTDCNAEVGYKILRIYLDKSDGNMEKALMKYRGSSKRSVNEKYARNILRLSKGFKQVPV